MVTSYTAMGYTRPYILANDDVQVNNNMILEDWAVVSCDDWKRETDNYDVHDKYGYCGHNNTGFVSLQPNETLATSCKSSKLSKFTFIIINRGKNIK